MTIARGAETGVLQKPGQGSVNKFFVVIHISHEIMKSLHYFEILMS